MRNLSILIFLISNSLWSLDLSKDVKMTLERVMTSEKALQLNFGGSGPAINLLSIDKKENFVVNHNQSYHLLDQSKFVVGGPALGDIGRTSISSSDNSVQMNGFTQAGSGSIPASVFLNSSESLSASQFFSSGQESLRNSAALRTIDKSLKADQYAQLTRDALDRFVPEDSVEKTKSSEDYSGIIAKKPSSLKKSSLDSGSIKVARSLPSFSPESYQSIKEAFPGIVLPPLSDSTAKSSDSGVDPTHSANDPVDHSPQGNHSKVEARSSNPESGNSSNTVSSHSIQDLPAQTRNSSESESLSEQKNTLSKPKGETDDAVAEFKSTKKENSDPATAPKKVEEVYAYHDKKDDLLFQTPKASPVISSPTKLDINEPIKSINVDPIKISPLGLGAGDIAKDAGLSLKFDPDSPLDPSNLLLTDTKKLFKSDTFSHDLLSIDEPLKIKGEGGEGITIKQPSLFASAGVSPISEKVATNIENPKDLPAQKAEPPRKDSSSNNCAVTSDKKTIVACNKHHCLNTIQNWNNTYRKGFEILNTNNEKFCYKLSSKSKFSVEDRWNQLQQVQESCSFVTGVASNDGGRYCISLKPQVDFTKEKLGPVFKEVSDIRKFLEDSLKFKVDPGDKSYKSLSADLGDKTYTSLIKDTNPHESNPLLSTQLNPGNPFEEPKKLGLGVAPPASSQHTGGLRLGVEPSLPKKDFSAAMKEISSIDPLHDLKKKLSKSIGCDLEAKNFQRKYQRFLVQFKKVSRYDGEGYCYNISSEKSSFNENDFKESFAKLQKSCEQVAEKALVNPKDIDRAYCLVLKKMSSLPLDLSTRNQYDLLSDVLNPQSAIEPDSTAPEANH